MFEIEIDKPNKDSLNVELLLTHVVEEEQCITVMRQMNVLWPHTESMCRNLCQYITNIVPDPKGENPLINLCMAQARQVMYSSLEQWRCKEITDLEVFNALKQVLVETAALATYWKVSTTKDSSVKWSPLNQESLLCWWNKHQEALTISKSKNRSKIDYDSLFLQIELLLIKDLLEDQLKPEKLQTIKNV